MWDKRYSGEDFAFGTDPNDFIREKTGQLPVGETLSLGEGEGRNAVFLAALGHKVAALDGSKVGLDKARAFAAKNGVEIETIHTDLATYGLEANSWDVIISVFCHLPPDLRKKVHGQIAGALHPGGCLILEAYTPQQLDYKTGGPPNAAMMDLSRNCAAPLTAYYAQKENDYGKETYSRI